MKFDVEVVYGESLARRSGSGGEKFNGVAISVARSVVEGTTKYFLGPIGYVVPGGVASLAFVYQYPQDFVDAILLQAEVAERVVLKNDSMEISIVRLD